MEHGTKKQSSEIERLLHRTIKKVSEDIENLHMNTAVSSLMILLNEMEGLEIENWKLKINSKKVFLLLLAPFAPYIAEELWQTLGEKGSIHAQPWPKFDAKKMKEDTFQLVVQVNGKVRTVIEAPCSISQNEAEQLALSSERVIKVMNGMRPARIIYVPGKLVNFVL